MKVPHPIPYQGSKRGLASTILAFFPKKPLRLVEPFAGSAAVSLAAASHGKSESFWLNDAHGALVGLWNMILSNPRKLAKQYAEIWLDQLGQERDYYNFIREQF